MLALIVWSCPALCNGWKWTCPKSSPTRKRFLETKGQSASSSESDLDLSDVSTRHELFADLGRRTKHPLIISEGLLVYLTEEEVTTLARDVAAPAAFQHWAIDLASPALLEDAGKENGRASRSGRHSIEVRARRRSGILRPEQLEARGGSLHHSNGRAIEPSLIRSSPPLPKFPRHASQHNRPRSAVCLLANESSA